MSCVGQSSVCLSRGLATRMKVADMKRFAQCACLAKRLPHGHIEMSRSVERWRQTRSFLHSLRPMPRVGTRRNALLLPNAAERVTTMNFPERTPKGASPLLSIDEQLLAAAIGEVSLAHCSGSRLSRSDGAAPKDGQTFFLFILLELMLPGINPGQVRQLLQQFVSSTKLKQLRQAHPFEA